MTPLASTRPSPREGRPSTAAAASLAVVAALLMGGGAPVAAQAAPATAATSLEVDPATKLRRTDAALRQLMRRQVPDWSPEASAHKVEAARLLGNLLDVQEMARLSLDRRWDALPADQRSQFVQALGQLAQQAFLDKLASDRRNEISYDAAKVDGDEARVPAALSARGDGNARIRAHLEYRLTRRDGRWMVYDVAVDGVSLVASYRAEFDRLLKNEPFEALLSRMHRKLRQSSRVD